MIYVRRTTEQQNSCPYKFIKCQSLSLNNFSSLTEYKVNKYLGENKENCSFEPGEFIDTKKTL